MENVGNISKYSFFKRDIDEESIKQQSKLNFNKTHES